VNVIYVTIAVGGVGDEFVRRSCLYDEGPKYPASSKFSMKRERSYPCDESAKA
jgi:hypothetical protein